MLAESSDSTGEGMVVSVPLASGIVDSDVIRGALRRNGACGIDIVNGIQGEGEGGDSAFCCLRAAAGLSRSRAKRSAFHSVTPLFAPSGLSLSGSGGDRSDQVVADEGR